MTDWTYTGDLDLTHGGAYYGPLEEDFIECVQVTPLSAAGGYDNKFQIVKGSIYTPREKWAETVKICGYELVERDGVEGLLDCTDAFTPLDTKGGKTMLADAFLAYYGIERHGYDTETIVQIGKDDPYCDPDICGGWNPDTDIQLHGNTKLGNYVAANYL